MPARVNSDCIVRLFIYLCLAGGLERGRQFFYTGAGRVGFEPTEAFTSLDFKSSALDQLSHLPIIVNPIFAK